jgi:hypothetical protein
MRFGMRRLRFFILLFAASSLLFQLPSGAFASSPSDITATDAETDGENSFTMLDGARGVATFTIGSSTYAIVASFNDDGVQIIDISDPTDIVATDAETDGVNSFTELSGAKGVDTFVIGSSTYAIVTGDTDDGVQIIDISDPTDIVAKDAETDGENSFTELKGATDVETFTIGSSTYAIVTAFDDDGVQIIDISDPTDISATDAETDGVNSFTELKGARGVDVFTIGSSTYAIVTGYSDDGVQIIDISDPTDIVAKDAETDGVNSFTELDGARGADTFVIGSSTYAIVTSNVDDGIQIIDISDPTDISATDAETDGENSFTMLNGLSDLNTFTIGSSTYAIVASNTDDGVQIIDISDPTDIVAKDAETDGENSFTMLNGARTVETFTIDSITYAIVTGYVDDGVQIIELNTDITGPTVTITSSTGDSGDTVSDTTLSYTVTFSESTSNFVVGDITVTGTANGGSPEASNFAGSGTTYTFDVVQGSSDGTVIVSIAAGVATDAVGNSNTVSNTYTLTIDTSTTSSMCTRLVILGNCGTIAINNDEYRIIHQWSTIPTTEVMVGEPVSITLSTPHNYVAGKINSVSVYTEIIGSAASYEESTHIYYTMNDDIIISDHATEKQLFQVAGATHRIVQDPDVKNLEMFEVVFTMVFAKPMDTSYIVVETKNKFGIPETIYLGNALKVIERPIELLTYEEKSKFELISEPELKVSLRPDMDIEPDMDMLVVDPEPVVSKVTCGNGTMLKANMCVVDEMSFYFFVNQFMRLFG